MTKFNAAVVRACSVGDDTAATLENAIRSTEDCGKQGINVAVFPEAFIGGYPKGANFNIFNFDVVGHYVRPDIFKLAVDERSKPPVERVSA
ncbi:nitrilase-related carbon-nitrogen hydrolase [Bradyrhizobium sp. AS23.2]|uniref:nitrilase-related carbon-nitrogen hydrolase n=1 Tax=Bradyrhizobium sp. AS23.2 TaxID=1680155 RepID=UPI000938BBA4|nr:nitrilase-related carbon-nitrogen hydrolase [Bradyrhizobium sp. AS23.2]OKO81942.1 hypothetical protein AC630_13675 [Bradyrhizobium sp. AS23.2]